MLDLERAAGIKDWVGERSLEFACNNTESKNLPFQSWRPFKEAFAPEIVQRAVNETPRQVKNLVDPFGGSGTSALTGQFLGVRPTTCEVNPFLADLIEAKLTAYNPETLIKSLALLERFLEKPMAGRLSRMTVSPQSFVEPGVKGRYIFTREVASTIVRILAFTDKLECKNSRRLFRVLLAPVAVEVSNIRISGKGRRYKGNWESRISSPSDLKEKYLEKISKAVEDILSFISRPETKFNLHRGDSRKITIPASSQDVAVFSPPYPNSFDYTDVYNVELWILGYLNSFDENRTLRESTLRSHVQIKREYETKALNSETLNNTYRDLISSKNDFWSPDIPNMILSYFADMKTVMANMSVALRNKGRLYCVVGDSQYAGHPIPVAKILSEMDESCGLKFLEKEEFRSMRTAPQQGGRKELPETLLIFQTLVKS